jgi:hypothetical protein
MNEQKKMDAILEATPWRCFHCDFITSVHAEAQAHFGDRDDGEEFKPICKWWDRMDDEERKEAFQDAMRDLNEGAQENMNQRELVED